jgi:hypothetical protein
MGTHCELPMETSYLQQVIHGNMDLASSDPGDLWVELWTGLGLGSCNQTAECDMMEVMG